MPPARPSTARTIRRHAGPLESAIAGCLAVWLALACGSAVAAEREVGSSPEHFGALPALARVVLSPSGGHFASLRYVDGVPYLAVRDLAITEGNATQFVRIDLRENVDERVGGLRWLNEETIGVVIEFDGDRFGVSTIETRLIGVSRDLSRGTVLPRPPNTAVNTQVAHRIEHLLPDDPDHILMSLDRNRRGLGIYKVDVHRGTLRMVERGAPTTAAFDVDHRGRVRLRYDIRGDRLELSARGEKKWRTVADVARSDGLGFAPVGFAADLDTAFVVAPGEGSRRGLFRYDLATASLGEAIVFDPGFDVSGVARDPYTGEVVGARYAIDELRTHYLDDEMRTIQQRVDATFPDTNNTILSHDRARRRVVVLTSSPTVPGTFYLYDREAAAMRKLGDRFPTLDTAVLRPVETIDYGARDGLKIHGYLTRPAGDAPYPLIVLPHGGPTARDYLDYDFIAQFLASRGYAVLQPNFRGSTGYGGYFQAAGYGQWGLAMQDDLEDGARAMIERGIAEAGRLGIVGWSYGGYAALMATVKTPKLFSCAVSGAGVSDVRALLAEKSRYKFATKNPPNVGHYRRDKDKLRENSPVNGVDEIVAPILLVHGDADHTVSVDQSTRMASRLARAEKTHELVILDNGTHDLDVERNRIGFLRAMERFLNRHLKPKGASDEAP